LVEGYHDMTDENFQRQFERDKDTLRQLGVPVETGTDDVYFEDEPGYRIRRDDFELPAVSFDADEIVVLVAAAQVWQQAATATATTTALAKLWASGNEPDTGRLAALQPHISAREPAWQPLWQAVMARQRVRFDYHDLTRTVQPWALTWRCGAWYLTGFDELRQAPRLYKLARLRGDVTSLGQPGAFDRPDIAVDQLWQGLAQAEPNAWAILDVRQRRAAWLTRRAELIETPDLEPGWQRWRLPYRDGGDIVEDLAMAGADLRVVEPVELAEATKDHFRQMIDRLEVS